MTRTFMRLNLTDKILKCMILGLICLICLLTTLEVATVLGNVLWIQLEDIRVIWDNFQFYLENTDWILSFMK
jgi:hypothetical protein